MREVTSAQSFRRRFEALKGDRRWQKRRGLIGGGEMSIKVLRVREMGFQGGRDAEERSSRSFPGSVGPIDSGGLGGPSCPAAAVCYQPATE